MFYDLATDGVKAFYQRRPGAQRLVRREPLSGLVDGTNRDFVTPHHPFLYDTFRAYLYGVQLDPGAFAAIDADGGVVQFNTAPLVQPLADYTAVPLTRRQAIYLAWAGFDLMESLWARGFALSSSDTAYVAATPDDDHAYVVTSPSVFTDPPCGSLTFSTSRLQQALLARCIEAAYLDLLAYESAAGDLDIRERIGGIAISSSQRPKNLLAMKEQVGKDLVRALYAAMEEYYPDGEQYADYVARVHTNEYRDIWQWQTRTDATITPRWLNW